MRAECHAHLFMNGESFPDAVQTHKDAINRELVAQTLRSYADAGIFYIRDGGDKYGVSAYAREIAPDYGITYASPIFAIHKKGRYGGIVGRGYESIADYRHLLAQAAGQGADFIKLMFSGILSFAVFGELSCPSLEEREIQMLVEIAHDAGFSVMAHVNGADAVSAALRAGTDSIEHGYYMDDECLALLAETGAVWVPTCAAVHAFLDGPGAERAVVEQILEQQYQNIRRAIQAGALLAAGSDAGAVGVPHAQGALCEMQLLREAAGPALMEELEKSLRAGNRKIQEKFRHRKDWI